MATARRRDSMSPSTESATNMHGITYEKPRDHQGFKVPNHYYIVTDVGLVHWTDAFFYLATGHHVWDWNQNSGTRYREITPERLTKYTINGNSTDPRYTRMEMWMSIPRRYFWNNGVTTKGGLQPMNAALSEEEWVERISQPGIGMIKDESEKENRSSASEVQSDDTPAASEPVLAVPMCAHTATLDHVQAWEEATECRTHYTIAIQEAETDGVINTWRRPWCFSRSYQMSQWREAGTPAVASGSSAISREDLAEGNDGLPAYEESASQGKYRDGESIDGKELMFGLHPLPEVEDTLRKEEPLRRSSGRARASSF